MESVHQTDIIPTRIRPIDEESYTASGSVTRGNTNKGLLLFSSPLPAKLACLLDHGSKQLGIS